MNRIREDETTICVLKVRLILSFSQVFVKVKTILLQTIDRHGADFIILFTSCKMPSKVLWARFESLLLPHVNDLITTESSIGLCYLSNR